MFKVKCSGALSLLHLFGVCPRCSLKPLSHTFTSLRASEDADLSNIRTTCRGALPVLVTPQIYSSSTSGKRVGEGVETVSSISLLHSTYLGEKTNLPNSPAAGPSKS